MHGSHIGAVGSAWRLCDVMSSKLLCLACSANPSALLCMASPLQVDYREQVGMLRKLLTPLSPRWVRCAAAVAGACGCNVLRRAAPAAAQLQFVPQLSGSGTEVQSLQRHRGSRGSCESIHAPASFITQPCPVLPPQDVTLLHFRKTGNRFATALLGLRIPDDEVSW